MSRFLPIDIKLDQLARELGGQLIKKTPEKMEIPRGFEQRQIRWEHNNLNLSIGIFPTIKGPNSQLNKWNFGATAWQDSDGIRYMKNFPNKENVTINNILSNIDELLNTSVEQLNSLELVNLDPVLNLETREPIKSA